MNTRTRQRHICQHKTARRNVYANEEIAEHRATAMTRKTNDPIRHFMCPVCHLWHIGRTENTDYWNNLKRKA